MKAWHRVLSVGVLWKVQWRLQVTSLSCSIMTHHVFTHPALSFQDSTGGSLSEQECTCTAVFLWHGMSSTVASTVWFIYKQCHESQAQPRAVAAVGKRGQIKLLPLLPQKLCTSEVQWILVLKLIFYVLLLLIPLFVSPSSVFRSLPLFLSFQGIYFSPLLSKFVIISLQLSPNFPALFSRCIFLCLLSEKWGGKAAALTRTLIEKNHSSKR